MKKSNLFDLLKSFEKTNIVASLALPDEQVSDKGSKENNSNESKDEAKNPPKIKRRGERGGHQIREQRMRRTLQALDKGSKENKSNNGHKQAKIETMSLEGWLKAKRKGPEEVDKWKQSLFNSIKEMAQKQDGLKVKP